MRRRCCRRPLPAPGIRLSDGPSRVLPVGDTAAVQAAWEVHARLVRRSLDHGFYQGWDLHPAQLPTRFGATYAFFRQAAPTAAGPVEPAPVAAGHRRAGHDPGAGPIPAARAGLRGAGRVQPRVRPVHTGEPVASLASVPNPKAAGAAGDAAPYAVRMAVRVAERVTARRGAQSIRLR